MSVIRGSNASSSASKAQSPYKGLISVRIKTPYFRNEVFVYDTMPSRDKVLLDYIEHLTNRGYSGDDIVTACLSTTAELVFEEVAVMKV